MSKLRLAIIGNGMVGHRFIEDLLDKAWGLESKSRLSCQAIVDQHDLTIEIPRYTINMAKEG